MNFVCECVWGGGGCRISADEKNHAKFNGMQRVKVPILSVSSL